MSHTCHKLALLTGICMSISSPLNATLGFLDHGVGGSYATGGAGAANVKGGDATGAVLNPALFSFLPTHVYAAAGILNVHPEMNAKGPLGNPIGNQKAVNNNFPNGSLGYVNSHYKPISFGVAVSPSGLGGKFAQPRTVGAARGNIFFDSTVRYRLFQILPTVSFKAHEKFSIGISAIVGYADFKSNFAKPQGLGLAQTLGGGDLDSAWGFGGKIGALWHAHPIVSLGLSYTTPVWFSKFNKYNDILIGPISTPAMATFGTNWHVTSCTDILADIKTIFWKKVKAIGRMPEVGGFGWKDQTLLMLGIQHRWNAWTIKLGYSHGNSQIPNNTSFANAIAPAILKNHITGGLSYQFSKKIEGSLNGFYAPRRTQTDPGVGDRFSIFGNGTTIKLSEYGAQATIKVLC